MADRSFSYFAKMKFSNVKIPMVHNKLLNLDEGVKINYTPNACFQFLFFSFGNKKLKKEK